MKLLLCKRERVRESIRLPSFPIEQICSCPQKDDASITSPPPAFVTSRDSTSTEPTPPEKVLLAGQSVVSSALAAASEDIPGSRTCMPQWIGCERGLEAFVRGSGLLGMAWIAGLFLERLAEESIRLQILITITVRML